MPCTKKGHNKKGSPRRLGRPEAGVARYPTTGEVEFAGLRKYDLIFVDPNGELRILRCKAAGLKDRHVLPLMESKMIEMCLEEYWSR